MKRLRRWARSSRATWKPLALAGAGGGSPSDSDIAPRSGTARIALDDAIAARQALELLASLPDRQLRYLVLKVTGRSYDDIWAVTDATYPNAKKNLCRARSRIPAGRTAAH